ncbi:MAG: hypothetical protein KC516_01890 [Nanoarchaeota archaeon]|nr:hypothetical protein [Nanoarchaeota archaeon]
MKFFADTADIWEIDYCFSKGVNDGITTNPKIMESTGDLSLGFEGASKNILKYFGNVPVSLETDLYGLDVKNLKNIAPGEVKEALLKQAYTISSWGKNTVIKIPFSEGGLLATKELSQKGVKTNVTACMTPYQALTAAKFGATYVSLFANRMLDAKILELSGHNLEEILTNPDWKEVVSENKEKFFDIAWQSVLSDISYVSEELESASSDLIVGSIRTPEDIHKLVKAKPQIITIPTKIVKGLENIHDLKNTRKTVEPVQANYSKDLFHPMTQYTLEEFEESAKKYRE